MDQNKILEEQYQNMLNRLCVEGIDVNQFFENNKYFLTNNGREFTPLTSVHPIIAHYPLENKAAGERNDNRLLRTIENLRKNLPPDLIYWCDNTYWHSTIATILEPEPEMNVSDASEFMPNILTKQISRFSPYLLLFDRIVVSSDGSILVLGYPNDHQLLDIRELICSHISGASAPAIVHITIGRLSRQPREEELNVLIRFCATSFKRKETLLSYNVDSVAICRYHAPVLSPTLYIDARTTFRH